MLLNAYLSAAEIISKDLPQVSFSLIKASTLPKEFYAHFLKKHPRLKISLVEKDSYETIRSSDLAIVCSGTATLECALLGTPMIICYKGTFLSYLIAKSLIQVPCLGLPNLILGEKRMPELLQYDATPKKIAETAIKILKDKDSRDSMRKDLEKVSEKLGEPGANRRAAEEVLKSL